MKLSKHAERRCDQRALPKKVIELVFTLGDEFRAGGGNRIITPRSKFSRKEFFNELENLGIGHRSGWENAYVVVDEANQIITAGHRTKRVKTNYVRHAA